MEAEGNSHAPGPPTRKAIEHDTAAIREEYLRETGRLLKRRIDLAVGLFITFSGLALLVDVVVNPERRVVGLPIYGLEILVCLAAITATRVEGLRRRVGVITAVMGSLLALLMNVYFSHVQLAPEIQALGLVCLMTAFAVLIPLGWAAQTVLSMATLVGFFVASIDNITFEQAAYCWVGLVAGATTSIFGATFLDRYRYEAFARAALLEQVSAFSQQEARISAALAHVGATLHASAGHTHVFDTVNRLAREIVGSDWCSTFVFDEAVDGFRLEASAGVRPWVDDELRSFEFPKGSLPLFSRFQPGELIEIQDASSQDLIPPDLLRRFDTSSALYVPIWRGSDVIGVLVNGYRERTGPFTPMQRRIATGIGNATAIALENERLVQNLQAASRMKSEFVSTMSHELRTPLNVITGYAEMLSDPDIGTLSTGQLDLVRRINRNAGSLLELIETTLHLGRLEAGRDTVQLEWFDLGEVFAQLARENEEAAKAADITLVWNQTGLAVDPVRLDRGKLKLILQNLIGNALKFSMGGRIGVTASGAEGRLTIDVRDTGVGMSAEDVAGIFEMFQQLDASAPGVGLGLHIVKRVTERLAGQVSVESEQGVGTCFTVSIPVEFEAGRLARIA